MADQTTLRRSPLEHLADRMAQASRPDPVGLAEAAYTPMVGLRVDPAAPAAARVATVPGAPLPSTCGEVTVWLGPDEWLALDLSANRNVLELSGPRARDVLERGCPVDLHPRAFGPGRAVQTTLARVPVLLWQTGEGSYRLLPRSSFADYVARGLLDAMVEFTG